jgi:hypothetical protein
MPETGGNMADLIDLSSERSKRDRPDAENIKTDDQGRPIYRFLLSYEFEGGKWALDVWAYSMDDAAARVEAMRSSLKLDGQAWTSVIS